MLSVAPLRRRLSELPFVVLNALTPAMMLGRRQLARAVTRATSACVEGRCAGDAGVSGAHDTTHRLHYAASEPFPRPVSQRVGVVGAGMSGLTTALALQLEGHRVRHVVRCGGGKGPRIAQPPPARPRR
jgi:hypothetical protein